jgi:hypothetical protein
MKGFILLVVAVLLAYAAVTAMKQMKINGDFAERVTHQLDFVSDTSMDSVKQDLISDGQKLGIDVKLEDIHIQYEDTDQHTVAQNYVGRIGVQYTNKRVTITVDFIQRILGIPFHKEIMDSHIRQVEAPRKTVSPEMNQLLEATPQ